MEFLLDTFWLLWGLFWNVWYSLPYVFSSLFVVKMYLFSRTTSVDDYNYTAEYRTGTKIVLQSFTETLGFFTGAVNSLLMGVNMGKALAMTRLGMSRKSSGSSGINPAAFAAMMLSNVTKRENVSSSPDPNKPRSPSLRKAIRPPTTLATSASKED